MTADLLLTRDHVIDEGAIVRVFSLNRPDQRNPLDHRTVNALTELIHAAELDEKVRCVVITGSGRAFSSGGDLRAYLSLYEEPDRFKTFLQDFRLMCAALETSRLITCAMVNGACVAGGLELALACDFLTIADGARIGDGHAAAGQLPGGGGSQRLVRAVGMQVARDLLLTGRLLESDEAVRVGLAQYAFPPERLFDSTVGLLTRVSRHSPLVTTGIKRLLGIAANSFLEDGLSQEAEVVHEYATTCFDATEGLRAFLERRPACYRGE